MSEVRAKVVECLEDMWLEDIVSIWNAYVECNNYYDDYIYNMCDLDYELESLTPTEILRKAEGEDFKTSDSFFYHTIYGINSCNNVEDSPICISDLAYYIIDNDDSLGNTDIEDILEEHREEEGENE